MQRTGRKSHAQFRLVVQDSRRTPTSGKYVALIGYYDPHSKHTSIEKERAEFYIKNGARPSPRVVGLLKKEGFKLPSWVSEPSVKKSEVRNPEKLRRNRPAEEPTPVAPESVAESEPVAAEEATQDSLEKEEPKE